MSLGRTVGVVGLTVVLTVSLFGGTVSAGAERTALDREYVLETFDDEGVSEEIGSQLRTDVASQIDEAGEQRPVPTGVTVELDGRTVANRTVTDEFVADEVSRNAGVALSYLRGNRKQLSLTTSVESIEAELRAALIAGTVIDTPELIAANSDRVSAVQVAALNKSERSYRDAQIELSERERTVLEAEIEQNVERQLANDSERLSAAVLELPETVLDGLTGQLDYEEYTDQLAADERAVESAIAELVLSEIPDEQSLVNGTDAAESQLQPVRSAAGVVVVLSWLGFVFAVVVVGALYAVTRSVEKTALRTGTGAAVAGLLGTLAGYVVGPAAVARSEPDGAGSDPVLRGLIAVFDGTVARIGAQSVGLLVVGVVVVGAVVADNRGLFDRVRRRLGG